MNFDTFRKNFKPHLICQDSTDLVIEGYPRSSNTFTHDIISAICSRTGQRKPALAHHTHKEENLALGLEMGKPLVVLIRKPEDAITSYMIYSNCDVELASQRYSKFYEYVASIKGQYTLLPFEMVTQNLSEAITRLNAVLPEPLPLPIPDDIALAKSYAKRRTENSQLTPEEKVRQISIPQEQREKMKAETREIVRQHLATYERPWTLYQKVMDE